MGLQGLMEIQGASLEEREEAANVVGEDILNDPIATTDLMATIEDKTLWLQGHID